MKLVQLVHSFLREEDGAAAIEYGLIAALIAVAIIAGASLLGTNLNGINDGAAYGDDNEMASNYPLVRLTDSSGNVTYARTTNWSVTGVSQGAETVTFTLPTADTPNAYLLQAVANGVPSATVDLNPFPTTFATTATDTNV